MLPDDHHVHKLSATGLQILYLSFIIARSVTKLEYGLNYGLN